LDEETRERSSHAPPAYWDDHGEAVAEIGALSEPLAQVITAMECGLCDIPTQVAVLAAVASGQRARVRTAGTTPATGRVLLSRCQPSD